MTKRTNLKFFKEQLKQAFGPYVRKESRYSVPELWIDGKKLSPKPKQMKINPSSFFLNALDAVINQKPTPLEKGKGGSWTRTAVIYNMFVRTTTAFDHNQNGKLDLPTNSEGWNETGTFLKAIPLLPYIKSLGVNTIHLLPITSIGSDGNKGSLGSPYAIKNPYKLDSNLSEPNLGLGVEEEFKAFVEGAHHLGMRVIVEFVFRTAAKDSDWVKEHPDWFYWIRADIQDRLPGEHDETKYGNPIFTPAELGNIRAAVGQQNLKQLPPPHDIYRHMFTEPPPSSSIIKKRGKWIGTLPDGTKVRIPGAFADWPPDDTQPPWGDVTYLKIYNHPEFNYIAYNTIRMYDAELAQDQNINRELWETISEIIPHYQRTFGIDGVMIDMGHALPMKLKREMIHRARTLDPDFAFWDENFSITEQSVDEGYNAVFGYLWSDLHHPEKFRQLLRRCAAEGFPIPFFATPENHNTPRAAARNGGSLYSKYAWGIANFLPAIPFLHSGFELAEHYPINTGLDFSREDLLKYPSEQLPLFSEYAYHWIHNQQFIQWVQTVSGIRNQYRSLIVDSSPQSFIYVDAQPAEILGFIRTKKGTTTKLLILANSSMTTSHEIHCTLSTTRRILTDLLSKKKLQIKHEALTGTLSPGEVMVFEL